MPTQRASQRASSTTDLPAFVNSSESGENMHPGIDTANITALVAKKIMAMTSEIIQELTVRAMTNFLLCLEQVKTKNIRQNLSNDMNATVNQRANKPHVIMKVIILQPQ